MKKLSKLIKEKKFDWVNSNITDDLFPVPEKISNKYKLFHFDRYISSENAIKEMEKENYVPANIYELLNWKGWNDKDWVIALGSVGDFDGRRGVPYLNGGGSRRLLNLRWFDLGWDANYRFLAVRNSESKPLSSEKSLGTLVSLTLEKRIESLESDMEKIKKFLII